MTIRVVVADDQALIRDAFSVLLGAQPDITIVGTAADGVDAVAMTRELRPDVVVMDIRMPRANGIEATAEIAQTAEIDTKVLVLTTFDLDEYVYAALRAGASGFLLKDASGGQLADAVRTVAAGDALLSPAMTKRLIGEFARLSDSTPGPTTARAANLTARESEVLTHVARGLSNAEIAAALVVAEQTVKTHMGSILGKLGLRDRTQAAVFAYETGLVTARRPPT